MDIDFYKNFLVLAESDTFSAAAQKLNIVQTALSNQITRLEDYYGVRLVKRQKGIKHIELTLAGVEFYKTAQRLCQLEEELALNMEKFNSAISGTLRFGVSPVRSSYFIEQFLMPFAKQHPEISFEFQDMLTVDQVEKIRDGSIDFAFSNAAIKIYPEFSMINFEQEQFYAIYRRNLTVPWAEREYLEIKDLLGLPLCSYFTQFAFLHKLCEKQGIKLRPQIMTNTLYGTLTVVKNSDSIGIVASTPSEKLPADFERKLIKNARLKFNQFFYWNKNRTLSLAAEAFLQYFQQRAKQML